MRITDRKTQREAIESLFDQYGITEYEYVDDLPMASIDREKSRRNQVRQTAVVPENVEQMVTALKQGVDLPPIIVTQDGKKYLIASGNNRDEAHLEVKRKTIAAYVVKNVDPVALRMLAVDENMGHGYANTKDERISHALDLMSTGNFAQKTVADRLGLSQSEVSQALGLREGQERSTRLGCYKQWERIGRNVRTRFNALMLDDVFKAAVILTYDAGLNGQQITDLLNGIKGLTGEKAMLTYISDQRRFYAERIQQVKAGVKPDKRGTKYDAKNAITFAAGHSKKFSQDDLIAAIKAADVQERQVLVQRVTETADVWAKVAVAVSGL